jgi:hypothetical protein
VREDDTNEWRAVARAKGQDVVSTMAVLGGIGRPLGVI